MAAGSLVSHPARRPQAAVSAFLEQPPTSRREATPARLADGGPRAADAKAKDHGGD